MPNISNLYVDMPLTNLSVAYKNIAYVSELVFPVAPVKFKTGIYYEYNKNQFETDISDVRAPATRAKRVTWDVSKKTYGPLLDHSLEQPITDEEREFAMQPLDLDTDGTLSLTERIMLLKEVNFFSKISDTAVITQNTTLTGTDLWSDYSNSSPFTDIITGRDTVSKAIMKPTNELSIMMSWPVFSKLTQHPDIIERIKYAQVAVVTPQLLAQLFQVKEVVISNAIEKTSNEGQATETLDYIAGKGVWIYYSSGMPGLKQITAGLTLNQPALGAPRVIEKWREQEVKSDFVRCTYFYEHKVVAAPAIYYITAAIA